MQQYNQTPKSAAANETVQKKSLPGSKGGYHQDNRPQSAAQLKAINALNEVPVQRKPNNTGLSDNLKSGIENLSGHSMDDVKVHYNSSQPAQLNAHAYAQGNQIHVAPGQEKHVPHEAWHVVQQKQGRVKPTMQMKGKVNVNDDSSLEKEADVMGAKAVNSTAQRKVNGLSHPNSSYASAIVQRAAAATALRYQGQDVVHGDQVVESVGHRRGSPLGPAIQYAWAQSPFNAHGPGAVANHHRAAQTIITDLIGNKMEGRRLSVLATNLETAYGALQATGHGLGAPMGAHRNVIAGVAGDDGAQEDRGTMDSAANYYMQKIYDFPNNLFYWPARTGGDPDNPANAYENDNTNNRGLPFGWAFKGGALGTAPADRLQATIDRVQQGGGEVAGATT